MVRLILVGCLAAVLCSGSAPTYLRVGSGSVSGRIVALGHDLAFEDGSPFFVLADTAWHLMFRLSDEELDEYLSMRRSQGFNSVMITLLRSDPASPNFRGERAFVRDDVTSKSSGSPNLKFLADARDRLKRVQDHGLVSFVLPTWGKAVSGEFFNLETAERWGEFVGQALGDLNVVWILGGDTNPSPREVAVWRMMARGLRRGESTRRLIGFHPSLGSASSWISDQDFLDIRTMQSGHSLRRPLDRLIIETIRRERKVLPPKPVIDLESGYENIPDGLNRRFSNDSFVPVNDRFLAYDIRVRAYQQILAGAAGYVYGNLDVAVFRSSKMAVRWPPNLAWREAMELPGARQMEVLSSFLDLIGRKAMVPADDLLLSLDQGGDEASKGVARQSPILSTRYGALNAGDYRAVVAGCKGDGSICAVYSASGAQFKVGLSWDARAKWFNPRTGDLLDAAGSVDRTSGGVVFLPPAYSVDELPIGRPSSLGNGHDWMLLLIRQGEK